MKTKLIYMMLALLFTATGLAQTFTVDGFNYNVLSTNPNEVEVTGGSDGSNPLTIRSSVTHEGITYTVTTIGNSAYRGRGLNNVILPNTITTIRFRAFRDNGGLTTVTLPASITSVQGEAFFNGGLNQLIAEGTVPASISNSSFGTRSNVDLIIPDGLEETYINAGWTGFNSINGEIPLFGTFEVGDLRYRLTSKNPNEVEVRARLNGIQEVVIPTSVVEPQFGETFTVNSVGLRAFKNAAINSVVFPNTLETIGVEAFQNNNLTAITFPTSLASIDDRAFRSNPLTNVTSQAVAAPTITSSSIENRGDINLTIPSGSEAAYESAGWTGFFLVNGVPNIGANFSVDGFAYRITGVNPDTAELRGGANGITDLVLPSTATKNGITFAVTAIGNRAFRNRGINSVVFPSSIELIGNEAFETNNLTTITLPASVTVINNEAFRDNLLSEVISQAVAAPAIEINSFTNRSDIDLTVPNGSETAYADAGWTGFFSINGTPSIGSTFSVDGFNYGISGVDPNTVELRGGGNGITDLVLPATTTKNGFSFTVTAIGNRAFRNRGINSVVLPSTIEVVGDEAFEINNLSAVTIPAAVHTIGSEAFINNSLTQVTFTSGPETIGESAFRNNLLTNVSIPTGTVTIGTGAFFNNQLTSITIPGTVDSIGREAFRDNQLGSVTIPQGVITIERGAFLNNQLTEVTMANTVETIGGDAFRGNQLTTVNLSNSLTSLGAGAFRSNQLTSIVIPNGVTEIGSQTFRDNDLTNVTLPENLQIIKNDAFRNNELTTISFPASLIELQGFAFRNNKLTSVTIPTTISAIGANTFSDNQLTDITIPANIQTIGNDAFARNPINILTANSATPATITTSSFGTRSTINLIIIPDEQAVIDDYIAAGWTGFGSVNGEFQVGARFIEGDLRYEVTQVNPNEVKVLNRVTTVQNITIPATVTESNSGTSFNVTAIEDAAFQNTDITAVTIGANMETIGNNAFQGASLTAVDAQGTTPATITASSFGDRSLIDLTLPTGLETVYANAGWTGFKSVNGELSDGLIGAQFTESGITFEVISIDPNEVAVTGSSVTGVVTIPGQVTFEANSFSVVTIATNAFQNDDITSVTLPASITTIEANAFSTDSLNEIIALGTVPATIEANSFSSREDISLTVPVESETAYENAGWTGFFSVNGSGPSVGNAFSVGGIRYEILTLSPNTVKAIGKSGVVPNNDYVFPELLSKNGVDFTITVIGNSAFRNRSVRTVILPSTLQILEFRAFRDNGNLQSVTLPASVTSVGVEAFFDCGLTEVISEIVAPPNISSGSFGDRSVIDLTIPAETLQAYLDAGWTGFKTITELGANIALSTRVFLQGASLNPFSGEEDLMRDNLRIDGVLPTTSPYFDGLTADAGVFAIMGPNAIVDWVVIELRDATDNSILIDGRSALLQRDGDVVDVDGVSPIQFGGLPGGDYHVVVDHRNHLAIITANAAALSTGTNLIDFTSDVTLAQGTTNALVEVRPGVFGLVGGDLDENGQVQNTDISSLRPKLGIAGYDNADLDMNGQIQNTDINNLLNLNLGKGEQF
ncbi:leucine-rich repeat protein [Sungkyunkwania multivorans]|uniref:Leucine-rich repeat protein n=1 Tax=Sungkyunkwania multivorans TaxID=1173618 RepID=A0ABW3CV35_9FLAO